MNFADKNFRSQFEKFVGLANDFCDPNDDSMSDVEIARHIRMEADPRERAVIFSELIDDADKILESIDLFWIPLQRYVNRRFSDGAAAKTWLSEIRNIWRDELDRLEKS